MSAVNIRTVNLSLSLLSKTAFGLDQHFFQDIAQLPDIALVSLGRNCQAELGQISYTNSAAFAVAGFVGQEKRR